MNKKYLIYGIILTLISLFIIFSPIKNIGFASNYWCQPTNEGTIECFDFMGKPIKGGGSSGGETYTPPPDTSFIDCLNNKQMSMCSPTRIGGDGYSPGSLITITQRVKTTSETYIYLLQLKVTKPSGEVVNAKLYDKKLRLDNGYTKEYLLRYTIDTTGFTPGRYYLSYYFNDKKHERFKSFTLQDSDYIKAWGDGDQSNLKIGIISADWQDEEYDYITVAKQVAMGFVEHDPIVHNYNPSIDIDIKKSSDLLCQRCTPENNFCGIGNIRVNDFNDAILAYGVTLTDVIIRLGSFGITDLEELVYKIGDLKDHGTFNCEPLRAKSLLGDYDQYVIMTNKGEYRFEGNEIINEWYRSNAGTYSEDGTSNAKCALSLLYMNKNRIFSECENINLFHLQVDERRVNDNGIVTIEPRIKDTVETFTHEFGHSFALIPDYYTHDEGCTQWRGIMCQSNIYYFSNRDYFGRHKLTDELYPSYLDEGIDLEKDFSARIVNFNFVEEKPQQFTINYDIEVRNKINKQASTNSLILIEVKDYQDRLTNRYVDLGDEDFGPYETKIISETIRLFNIKELLNVKLELPIDGQNIDNIDFKVLSNQENVTCIEESVSKYDIEKIKINNQGLITEFVDQCSTQYSKVEVYCDNNEPKWRLTNCESGCSYGACIQEIGKRPNKGFGASALINRFNEHVGDLEAINLRFTLPNPTQNQCAGVFFNARYKPDAKQESYVSLNIYNTAGRNVNFYASSNPIPFVYNGANTERLSLLFGKGNEPFIHPNPYVVGYGWSIRDINMERVAQGVYWFDIVHGNLRSGQHEYNDITVFGSPTSIKDSMCDDSQY